MDGDLAESRKHDLRRRNKSVCTFCQGVSDPSNMSSHQKDAEFFMKWMQSMSRGGLSPEEKKTNAA